MEEKSTSEKKRRSSSDSCVKKGNRKVLSNLLNEYSKSSTLHGLRYITERELSIYEKTFWLVTFLVSVSMCFIVIVNLYLKWKSNPIIVTLNENIISASQISFPSITICPQSKCRVSVFNYTAARNGATKHYFKRPRVIASFLGRKRKRSAVVNKDASLKKFSNIATVCEGNDIITHKLKEYNEEPSDASLVQDLEQVAEPLNHIFFRCIWRGIKTDCENLFKKVLTREGVCFNVNAIAVSEILKLNNLQSDYKYMDEHISDKSGKPRPGRINGAGPDLDIVLKRNVNDRDLSCNTLNNGYKIYMQNPDDFPTISHYHYTALDSQSTSLAIKCNILNTTDDLKGNSPEERQCYFEEENNLAYFNKYTAHNCWLECLSKHTYKKCGCVGFYMPHNDSHQICNFVNYKCILEVEDELANMEASGNTLMGCNCLPSCYAIDYSAEAIMSEFNYKTLWEIEYDGKFNDRFQYSRIVLFFKQPGFVAMRRSKLFGWIDFIANCGGLLGLFLGFSVLSVVEIIYYITIRFWCSSERGLIEDSKRQKNKNHKEIYSINT